MRTRKLIASTSVLRAWLGARAMVGVGILLCGPLARADSGPAGGTHPSPTLLAISAEQRPEEIFLRKRLFAIRQREGARIRLQAESLVRSAPDRSSMLFAHAYVLTRSPMDLERAIEGCLRAGLDVEAIALFERLQREGPGNDLASRLHPRISELRVHMDFSPALLAQVSKGYLQKGLSSVRMGDLQSAGEAFSLTYAMATEPLPRLLFNIAQTYRRAGQAALAYLAFSAFLAEDPGSEQRKEATIYLGELRPIVLSMPLYRRPWFVGLLTATSVGIVAVVAALAATNVPRYPDTDLGYQGISFP